MNRIPIVKAVTNDDDHRRVAEALAAFVRRHDTCAKTSPEAAYLHAQALILSDYEKRRWPIPREWGNDWDPVDYIKEIAAERCLPQRELAFCFGSQPNCSAVLNRRRGLTLPMIRKLHAKLGIPADILIRAPKAPLHGNRRAASSYPEELSPAPVLRDGTGDPRPPAKASRNHAKKPSTNQ
jgi:HTH-type transcriptional regulator / antitoxin HigA